MRSRGSWSCGDKRTASKRRRERASGGGSYHDGALLELLSENFIEPQEGSRVTGAVNDPQGESSVVVATVVACSSVRN